MAKFLTTTGTSFYIENIIIESEQFITLVTPYLKLTNILIDRLTDAEKQNVEITIIYGKNELSETQKKVLAKFKNIEIYFCQNLHAKCYHNEKTLIISSMNLFEFSERNNREMGILIDKNLDSEIFNDTLKEIQSIKNSSTLEKRKIETKSEKFIEPINESYNEKWNFHLPSMFTELKRLFPKNKIDFDKKIMIMNFPVNGINTEIDSTIDFKFSNKNMYDTFKEKYKSELNVILPQTRFFWNRYVLNVYPPKNFEITFDNIGRTKKIEYLLNVLSTVYQVWNKK